MCCDTCYLWIPVCPVAPSPSHHPCMCSFPGEGRGCVSSRLPLVNECCWNSQSSSCVKFAPFSFHHFVTSCITKIQSVAKGGPILPKFWSCGPVRIDIECTLTLDCVGCVLFREKSPAFHPFECHLLTPFILPSSFLAVCSYCSSHIGVDLCLLNWECASLDFKIFFFFFFNTVFVNISELLILGGEYFWWYVRNILSSVHMALFALAGCRAKLSLPPTPDTHRWWFVLPIEEKS